MLLRIRKSGRRPCQPGAGEFLSPAWLTLLSLLSVGQLPVEAQGTPDSPVFEMRFEADSVRVLRNEFQAPGYRSTDDKPPSPFPFPAVASSGARQVAWFHPDGTISANRSYSPQAHSVRVSSDGKLILVVHREGGEYSGADLELSDAEGNTLWRKRTHAYFGRHWSPTGDILVYPGHWDIGGHASFWGPTGLVAEYGSDFELGPVFSSDGRRVLVQEVDSASATRCLSLFDNRGQRLWQGHCSRENVQRIYISETGRYMAFTYYTPDSYVDNENTTPKQFVVALDSLGTEMWTRPVGWVHQIHMSEQQGRMVLLNNRYIGIFGAGDTEDLEAVFLDLSTGAVQRRFPLADFLREGYRMGPFSLLGEDLLLGHIRRTPEGDFSAHLRRYDSAGTVSWTREFSPDTEIRGSSEPVWMRSDSFVGVSIGRTFALFDLGH